MKLEPISPEFVARITDVDLRQLNDAQFSELYSSWLRFGLLIFPGQHFDKEAQVGFARRFGELEFDYAALSNVTRDGSIRGNDDVVKILKGNMDWHCDSTYMPTMAKGAVFSAHVVPQEGGQTGWADMRQAYDALDSDIRRKIQSLRAHHSLQHSQAKLNHQHSENSDYSGYGFHDGETPLRPLVKDHPETGRKSLLIGRHAYGIPGLSESDSTELLRTLVEQATMPEFCYVHTWSEGDVVIWDNRCLLHRAFPWDLSKPRTMYHSRIAGDSVTEAAL